MSYDPKCEELAEYFLGRGAKRKTVETLAQLFQDVVEANDELFEEAEERLSDV